jgi:hypothetical protein
LQHIERIHERGGVSDFRFRSPALSLSTVMAGHRCAGGKLMRSITSRAQWRREGLSNGRQSRK